MKKLFVIALSTLIVGAGTLTSCSKYAEGPSMTLSSKKSRLAGEWVLSAKTLNGNNVIVPGYTETLVIGTDGSFSDTSRYSNFVGTAKGTWTFSDDKLKVNFNATSTNLIFTVNGINAWNIIKLAKDEIKFEQVGSNNSVTAMTYVPKN
ncbi:MAG: hypothetical protein RLZZ357_1597 [Bacteroidota bacterium]|jgi:hypothetical protein